MNATMKQFEVMKDTEFSTVEVGVSCFEGVVGVGSLGATAGPLGAGAGATGGSTTFCYSKVK